MKTSLFRLRLGPGAAGARRDLGGGELGPDQPGGRGLRVPHREQPQEDHPSQLSHHHYPHSSHCCQY